MLVTILQGLVVLVLAGIVFWIAMEVLKRLGVEIPQKIMGLVGMLLLLLVVLWLFMALGPTGTFPGFTR